MFTNINVFKYGYMSAKYPRNWWHNIKQFFKNIRYAWQRATKGYCEYDLWDVDTFHSNLFINMLEEFRDTKEGFPSDFNKEEQWDDIINQIVQHMINFRDAEELYPNPYAAEYHEILNKAVYQDAKQMTRYFDDSLMTDEEKAIRKDYFKMDKERMKWQQEELEKALALFAEWYQHFWW